MKLCLIRILLATAALGNCVVAAVENDLVWTWLHRKKFNHTQRLENSQKKEIIFSKTDVPRFSQLIFSWNALRPVTGHFSFYAKVRDSKTKKWSKWHKMIDWGSDVQISYRSRDDFSQYHHVRLEINHLILSDAFCIKIVPQKGADLGLLHGFAVNVSDFTKFNSEESKKTAPLLHSVHIQGAPQISQFKLTHHRNDSLCSPTSCTMLTSYLSDKSINPISFAEKSIDKGLDIYGSWPFNMAHAFENCDGNVHFSVARCNSFINLHDQLVKGIPVIVSVRGAIEGAPKVYPHGHLLMVVGYDAHTHQVICHDPAAQEHDLVYKKYNFKSFLQAWERSHRLIYLAEKLPPFSSGEYR